MSFEEAFRFSLVEVKDLSQRTLRTSAEYAEELSEARLISLRDGVD